MTKTGWYLLLSGPPILATILFFSLPVAFQFTGHSLVSVWAISLWVVFYMPLNRMVFSVLSAIGVFISFQIMFNLFPLDFVDRILLFTSIFSLTFLFFCSEETQKLQSFWTSGILLLFTFGISTGIVPIQ